MSDRLWTVEVPDRYDGTYIFQEKADAEAFAAIVDEPVHEETLITPDSCAGLLIDTQKAVLAAQLETEDS